MLPENFKESVLWKDLMERTSKFPEMNGDMEYLIEDVVKKYIPYKDFPKVNFNAPLCDAFWWRHSPQWHHFWWNINYGILPKEYT